MTVGTRPLPPPPSLLCTPARSHVLSRGCFRESEVVFFGPMEEKGNITSPVSIKSETDPAPLLLGGIGGGAGRDHTSLANMQTLRPLTFTQSSAFLTAGTSQSCCDVRRVGPRSPTGGSECSARRAEAATSPVLPHFLNNPSPGPDIFIRRPGGVLPPRRSLAEREVCGAVICIYK